MELDLGPLIDSLPGLVWTAHPDGRAEYLGKGWLDYTGLTFEEAVGLGWIAAIHPDDVTGLLQAWSEMVASGREGEYEARMRRHDGVYRWFLFRPSPMPAAPGALPRWCGMNIDIDDRVRVARYLTEAQRISRTGSFTWDVEADEHNWSDETYRIWEVEPGTKLTAHTLLSAVHPDDLAHTEALIGGAVRGEDFDLVFRIITPSGALKHMHVVGRRIEEITDRPVFLGTLHDVTESRIAEEALKRANNYLTEAQRLSQTGSFIWDVAADEHDWSDEVFRIFEFEPGRRVSNPLIHSVIHADDLPAVEIVLGRAAEGLDFDFVFRIVTASGSRKHVRVVGRRMEQVIDRLVYIGALQDVTTIKAAEEALNLARAELAHVSRVASLNTLTASMAHEVNQPLSGILTNASTCLRMLAATPPNIEGARKTAQRTIRDGKRASDVIKGLRAMFARKNAPIETVDLNEAAREVLALSSSELQRGRVIVRSSFADDLPSVLGDRVQLQQVILNLVLNAADAMRQIVDRPRNLSVTTAPGPSNQVTLSVRDNGVGIDPEHLELVFDTFYSTKSGGMGIGLSISRTIIQGHDGRLWAEPNESGPGATFSFTVPCAGDVSVAARDA